METQGATLILYGELPVFRDPVSDAVVFDGKLTDHNRRSFEHLLVRELGHLMDRNLRGATVKPLRSVLELRQMLKRRTFSTVIFYGHTINLTSNGPIEGHQELALAGHGEFMSPRDFANALKPTAVRETLIAGCSSVSFAAGVFTVAPTIRAGGLPFDRIDDAKGNASTVIDLRIGKQAIKWWVPR
jgi:hypothetical protein